MTQLDAALITPHRLTLLERLLLNVLTDSLAERDVLVAQAKAAPVWWEQTNGQPALIFDVPTDIERIAGNGVIAEGEASDVDGGVIHILMHVRHGILTMISLYREDGLPIIVLPKTSSVERSP